MFDVPFVISFGSSKFDNAPLLQSSIEFATVEVDVAVAVDVVAVALVAVAVVVVVHRQGV
jgi:hypothetical protein